MDCVIAPEIQTEDCRHRAFDPVRHIDQQVHSRPLFPCRIDRDLEAGRLAAKRCFIAIKNLGNQPIRPTRRAPIHFTGENSQ